MEKAIKMFLNDATKTEIFFGAKEGVIRLQKDGAYTCVDFINNGEYEFKNAFNVNHEDINEVVLAKMIKLFIEY